jgi:hypothetical protein
MDDNDRRRLIEFHVTPLIEHAVNVLRAMIPPGRARELGTYLLITRRPDNTVDAELSLEVKGTIRSEKTGLNLSKEQHAAFEFLDATAAYHRFVIEQEWPNMERRSRKRSYATDLPQYGGHALGMAFGDAELRLRVDFIGAMGDVQVIKINP